jgi:hypothetical protein
MLRFTCLPTQVANWLQVLRPMFRHRHHLVFCWFLACQAVYQEKATVIGLARLTPRHSAAWHLRRLLMAAYWHWRVLLWWFADQVIAALPPPDDGVCSLVVDSTLKDKTGQKHPLAKKGRLNEFAPYVFGLHLVIVMLQWGNYRIPVDCELVRRKDDPHYRSENRLFRWMLVRFRRPAWAETVVVVADAAFASKANVQLIQQRGYFFVMAFARTWCFDNGHTLKDLVTHLPKHHYRRCWVPLDEPGRRRIYWTFTKRVRLRHVGDVTIMLSKERRHDGPKPTKILVTNLPDVRARQVVDIDRRRWSVEIVQTQMTKRDDLSRGARGDHVPNLHWAVGDDDAIDQQLHQSSALGKRELVQGRLHLPAKRFESLGHGGDVHLLLRLRFQLAQLLRQALLGLGHFLSFALELIAPNDLGQIDLQQADLLPFELREGLTEGLPPGLQGLGQPFAAVGTGEFMGDERWLGQDPAEILPDQPVQGPGRGKARRATVTPSRPQRIGSATTDIVGITRWDGTPHARQLTLATTNQAPE